MLELAAFHFLRPWWLLAAAVTVALFVVFKRRSDARKQFEGAIAPHLLEHLVVGGGSTSRLRPASLVFFAVFLMGLGAAGPTWQREAPPFAEDQAAIVLVMDTSQAMNAVDVPPTRLERAKQKVRDLLARREGARTALIAYAGDAFVVLPLTDDRGIIELYLEALDTEIMPVRGNKPSAALTLAQELIDRGGGSGSILFFTSGMPARERPAFVAHRRRKGASVQVLAVGTDRGGPVKTGKGQFATDTSGKRVMTRLDREGLETLQKEAGVVVTYVQVGDSDVADIDGRAQRDFADAQAAEGSRWKDAGYYLLFLIVPFIAFSFRRGWSVQWMSILLVALAVFGAEPAHADESKVADLFWTPDQQGRRHLDAGEFEAAAAHFEDPMWKGVAFYKAGDYASAVEQFARLDTAAAWFNLGNSYARLERFDDALKSYDEALKRQSGYADARFNRDLVAKIKKKEEEDDEEPAEGGSRLEPDKIVPGDKDDETKRPEQEETVMGGTMDEKMAEVWMRQVQTRPADFLRMKFAIQSQSARKEDDDK